MARVTYLLGAGASAGSLPTVDRFEEEIKNMLDKLRLIEENINRNKNLPDSYENVKRVLQFVRNDLFDIYVGCGMHRSIDTYAKRIYLTVSNDNDKFKYRVVKSAIILFFDLYRFYNENSADKRYDAFLATILKKENPKFPSDINVLSWNYDYEFERAYLNYIPERRDSINNVYGDMNIVHKNYIHARPLDNNFGIIKINGTSGFIDKKTNRLILGLDHHKLCFYDFFDDVKDVEIVYPLLKSYYEYVYGEPERYEPAISFAWEDDYGTVKIKDEIKNALANTEKIIVIGYSFPYFNREIDSYIMECFEKYYMGRIYVQAPGDKVAELIENVKELRKVWHYTGYFADVNNIPHTALIPKTGLDQFFMSF